MSKIKIGMQFRSYSQELANHNKKTMLKDSEHGLYRQGKTTTSKDKQVKETSLFNDKNLSFDEMASDNKTTRFDVTRHCDDTGEKTRYEMSEDGLKYSGSTDKFDRIDTAENYAVDLNKNGVVDEGEIFEKDFNYKFKALGEAIRNADFKLPESQPGGPYIPGRDEKPVHGPVPQPNFPESQPGGRYIPGIKLPNGRYKPVRGPVSKLPENLRPYFPGWDDEKLPGGRYIPVIKLPDGYKPVYGPVPKFPKFPDQLYIPSRDDPYREKPDIFGMYKSEYKLDHGT